MESSGQQIKRAVEAYEKAGKFIDAANVALEAGMKKRAKGLYKRAVEDYENAGRFGDAANVALGAGMTERAVEDYENAGRFRDAANAALEAGMKKRAKGLGTLADLIIPYTEYI